MNYCLKVKVMVVRKTKRARARQGSRKGRKTTYRVWYIGPVSLINSWKLLIRLAVQHLWTRGMVRSGSFFSRKAHLFWGQFAFSGLIMVKVKLGGQENRS